jgi:hypothetical protein
MVAIMNDAPIQPRHPMSRNRRATNAASITTTSVSSAPNPLTAIPANDSTRCASANGMAHVQNTCRSTLSGNFIIRPRCWSKAIRPDHPQFNFKVTWYGGSTKRTGKAAAGMRPRRGCRTKAAWRSRSVMRILSVPAEMCAGTMLRIFARPSVTGLAQSIPFLRHPLAGVLLLYGVGARPPPDGVRRG